MLGVYDELIELADYLEEYEHCQQSDKCYQIVDKICQVFGFPNGIVEWKEFEKKFKFKAIQIKAEERARYKEFKPLLNLSKEI